MEIIHHETEQGASVFDLSLDEMEISGVFACTHEVHSAMDDAMKGCDLAKFLDSEPPN